MSQKHKRTQKHPAHSYHSATGKIRFTLINDYMFKIIFQNTDILLGFLCALLSISPEEVRSLKVTNPILAGTNVRDKAFILDIHVTLNNSAFINIELQVANRGNWPDRSLSYLCRSFDRLYHGEDYSNTKQVLHIGILDFTLFLEYPEFYAAYRLMNMKNHQIYNDKFRLNVLELNRIHLATEEDKERGLVEWAALFKAQTWEEIKMLAAHNAFFGNLAQELYEANADDRIRQECEAREEFYFEQRRQQQRYEDLQLEQRRQQQEFEELKRDASAKEEAISSLEAEIARLREKLAAAALGE